MDRTLLNYIQEIEKEKKEHEKIRDRYIKVGMFDLASTESSWISGVDFCIKNIKKHPLKIDIKACVKIFGSHSRDLNRYDIENKNIKSLEYYESESNPHVDIVFKNGEKERVYNPDSIEFLVEEG